MSSRRGHHRSDTSTTTAVDLGLQVDKIWDRDLRTISEFRIQLKQAVESIKLGILSETVLANGTKFCISINNSSKSNLPELNLRKIKYRSLVEAYPLIIIEYNVAITDSDKFVDTIFFPNKSKPMEISRNVACCELIGVVIVMVIVIGLMYVAYKMVM